MSGIGALTVYVNCDGHSCCTIPRRRIRAECEVVPFVLKLGRPPDATAHSAMVFCFPPVA